MTKESEMERARELAEQLANTGGIGTEQAKVYAFRDVYGFGRSETADLLDKSPNTVDNLRPEASKRVFQARRLIDTIQSPLNDLVVVRRSREKIWHRDRHDPQACPHALGVQLRSSYEYKAVPETRLDSLGGKLCDRCFR